MLALRGLRTLRVRTPAFGPRLEKSEKPLIFVELPFLQHIYIISCSQHHIRNQRYPSTPVYPLKPRFWDNIEICLLFGRKQQQIFTHVFDNITFGISEPDYPSITVETTFLGQFQFTFQ